MTHRMAFFARRGWLVTAAALALAWMVAPASATVMTDVPLELLVHESDAIVVGTIEHVGVRMDLSGGRGEPQTVSTLRVREWLKGEGGDVLRVSEIGGRLPHGGVFIAGTPRYHVHDEVVLFLRRMGNEYRTHAMEQGHFTIRRGVPGVPDTVERDLRSLGIASFGNGAMQVEHGGRASMRLDDFLAYVRAMIDQPRTSDDPARDALGGAR